MLKSERKYNFILSGTILQLEGLGKLINRELLYDLKKNYRSSPGNLPWQPTVQQKIISHQITYFKIKES